MLDKLTEEVPYSARTNTHKHLIKLWSRRVVERNVGLSGHSPSQQSLSGAGWTDKEDPWEEEDMIVY